MPSQECLITVINPSNEGHGGTSVVPTEMSQGQEVSLVYSPRLTGDSYPGADCVARQLLARTTMISPSASLGEPAACARCAGEVFIKRASPKKKLT